MSPTPHPHAPFGPARTWWNPTLVKHGYRTLVVKGTYPLLWGCHERHVLGLHYNGVQDGDTVLEIGSADGGHLDRIGRKNLTVHLMDVNADLLHDTATRLARYHPHQHHTSALEKFPLEANSVDAVVLSMVVHCLPGNSIADKATVFDHVARVLRPGGRFVGATVLTHGVDHHPLSRAGLVLLNRQGVFSNRGDSLADLTHALRSRFDDVTITVVGRVALWQVRGR